MKSITGYEQEGAYIVTYHGGKALLRREDVQPFLHVGTLAQARQRGGPVITRLTIAPGAVSRLRDRGENIWKRERLQAVARRGAQVVVYLNRHEGVDLDEVEVLRLKLRAGRATKTVDNAGDELFRRFVPSAADSLIILDPAVIVKMEAFGEQVLRHSEGKDA